jgi:NTE family protein
MTEGHQRRALVLCGGGIVGGLYEVGALLALDTLFENFTTAQFDFYVGSSAGAFVCALLANRVSPERIRDALETDRRTLPRLTGAQFLSVAWRSHLGTVPRLAAALPGLARDLWAHWNDALVLETLASLTRLLPRGVFTLAGLESYVRGVLARGGRTNDFRRLRRRLLVPAVALDTGAIRVFGAKLNERTPISQAVAASAAIPMLFEPVRIDGVDYVDGMVTKTAHAGLAADRGARLVVIVNPLRPLDAGQDGVRLAEAGPLAIAGQALRIAVHRRLHEALARWDTLRPGTDVVLFEPWERDLALFDTPLMTYSRRQEVVRRGYRTTVKTFLAQYDRLAALFARHGIAVARPQAIEARAERWSSKRPAARDGAESETWGGAASGVASAGREAGGRPARARDPGAA